MSIDIKILQSACCGPDLPIKEQIKTAAENLGVEVTMEQPTDLQEIMQYGTMTFPSIVVNDEVHAYSEIGGLEELESLLQASAKIAH